MPTSDVIKLPAVRLSFPRLFTPKAFREGQEPRFEATFLLDPSDKTHAGIIAHLTEVSEEILKEHFNGNVPKGVKYCFGSGDDKEYDGYEGMKFISTSNRTRPTVVDRDRVPLVEADGKPYAGCYVNASITLWVMDNEFGKRVNANLRAVQFVRDGEAFGVKPVDAEEEFDVLDGDEPGGDDDFLS